MIVEQVLVRCIQPIDSACSLLHNFVGVVLRVEYDGIGLDAVPTFCTCIVLDQIQNVYIQTEASTGYAPKSKRFTKVCVSTLSFTLCIFSVLYIIFILRFSV